MPGDISVFLANTEYSVPLALPVHQESDLIGRHDEDQKARLKRQISALRGQGEACPFAGIIRDQVCTV